MENRTKLIAGVSVLALLVWFAWSIGGDDAESVMPSLHKAEMAEASKPVASTPLAEAFRVTDSVSKEAEIVTAEEEPSGWVRPERFPFSFHFGVGGTWMPWPDARVFVAVEGQGFNRCPSGSEGGFSAKFEANQSRVRLHVFAYGDDSHMSGIKTFHLRSGYPLSGHLHLLNLGAKGGRAGILDSYVKSVLASPVLHVDESGLAHFVDSNEVVLPAVAVAEAAAEHADPRSDEIEERPPLFSTGFSGVVRREDGEFAVGASVSVADGSWDAPHQTMTDHVGRWSISGLAEGGYSLVAGGDEFGIARKQQRIISGEELTWDAQLSRTLEALGRLVGPNDEPLQLLVLGDGFELGYAHRFVRQRAVVSDEKGRFSFPNSRRQALHIWVVDASNNPVGFPLHVQRALVAGQPERVIEVSYEELQQSTISISLRDSEGEPIPDAEVRLLSPGENHGVFLKSSPQLGGEGHYTVNGIPAGTYDLFVSAGKLGHAEFRTQTVLPGRDLGFGLYGFAPRGSLAIDCSELVPGQVDDFRIQHLGDRVDSLAWTGSPVAKTARVPLAEGDYVLSMSSRVWGRTWLPFHITSDVETLHVVSFPKMAQVRIEYRGWSKVEIVVLYEDTKMEALRVPWVSEESFPAVNLVPGTYRFQAIRSSEDERSAMWKRRGGVRIVAEKVFKVKSTAPISVKLR